MTTASKIIIDRIYSDLQALQENLEQNAGSTLTQRSTFDPQEPTEMLTVKECSELFENLSAHTIRKLVHQGKIKCFRASEGKRGKILINKASLIAYLNQ